MNAKEIAVRYLHHSKDHADKNISTDKVVIENLRVLSQAYLDLDAKQKGHKLVPVVDCPNCGNVGYTVEMTGTTAGCCNQPLPNGECCGNPVPIQEPEQCQCEFCYTVPNSVFNINSLLASLQSNDRG